MKGSRIIEIAEDGRFLGVERGFLSIKSNKEELGKVPLDDIAAVICTANYSTLGTSTFSKLAANGIPLVICDKLTKVPTSFVLPMFGNYRQGDIISAQADSSKPLNKSLWQDIVRAKIKQQYEVLKFFKDKNIAEYLTGHVTRVKSGDIENIEGQAAAYYWKELMGASFVRDRFAENENIYLNYGYTVLRAAAVRAICAAGLHPSLGIHHKSTPNRARLADDLMEPFRPFVDFEVKCICDEFGVKPMDVVIKKRLASVIDAQVSLRDRQTNILILLHKLAQSLARVYLGEAKSLNLETVKSFHARRINTDKRISTDVDVGDV